MCTTSPTHHSTTAHVPFDLGAFTGDRIPLEPVTRVSITTLVDNVADLTVVDQGPAHRRWEGNLSHLETGITDEGFVLDGPNAEHGFSVLVEIEKRAGDVHRLLFDTGVSPNGMVENMSRLDIDASRVEVVVCSRGHVDHTAGLAGLARRLGPTNLPVIIHPEFWSRRRIALPGMDPVEMPTTSRRALIDAGFDIIEDQCPSFVLNGAALVTGEVARTTDFEHGMPYQEAWHHGHWEPDPLILDDQALVVHLEGRGLVVLTGCGHAGIVNIARYARHLTGISDVHAVLGGFHLGGGMDAAQIAPTVAGLAELRPEHVVPAHCTGWPAAYAIAHDLPDAFIQNTVGTRYDLLAA